MKARVHNPYPGIPALRPSPPRVGCLFLPDTPNDPAPKPPAQIAHLVHVRRAGQAIIWCVSAPASLQRICPDGQTHLPIPRAGTHPFGVTRPGWNLCWPSQLTNPLAPTPEGIAVQCVYFPKTGVGTPAPPDAPPLQRESFGRRWKVCATAPAVFRKSCPTGWRSMGIPDAATDPNAPTSSGWLLCWPRPRAAVGQVLTSGVGSSPLPGMGVAARRAPRAPRAPALVQGLAANPAGSLMVFPMASGRNPDEPKDPCDKTCQAECWAECDYEHEKGYGPEHTKCVNSCVKLWGGWPEGKPQPRITSWQPPPTPVPPVPPRPLPGMFAPAPQAPFAAQARAARQIASGMQLPGMTSRMKFPVRGQAPGVSSTPQSVSVARDCYTDPSTGTRLCCDAAGNCVPIGVTAGGTGSSAAGNPRPSMGWLSNPSRVRSFLHALFGQPIPTGR